MTQKETTHNPAEKLESSQQHAKKALETTTAAAREIADSARFVAQSAYRESRNELSAAASDMKHAACATYSSLADQTSEVANKWCERATELELELSEHVREKPLQALGVAFGVGLFLGILLNRK
ncbi:MAG: hypothetical protein QE493_03525 [Verrucomicrobiae bacterium]|jgi:ElaB/YqjD/DUF883 family membrane-anchored ribosome-binding protein|nr:hypothetical protein [Verrucomicrobiae bacterium]